MTKKESFLDTFKKDMVSKIFSFIIMGIVAAAIGLFTSQLSKSDTNSDSLQELKIEVKVLAKEVKLMRVEQTIGNEDLKNLNKEVGRIRGKLGL
jgi:uncharacterized membrane protein (DUF106 family)